MKVLLITADFPPIPSGEAGHAYYLAKHLAKRDVEMHVLTSRIRRAECPEGVTVHARMPGWSWANLPRLARFLNACSPDVMFLLFLGQMYRSHPMMTFAPTIAKKVVSGMRVVTQFEHLGGARSWASSSVSRAMRRVAAYLAGRHEVDYEYGTLLRDSDEIICLSEGHQRALGQRLRAAQSKCSLIPPPPITEVLTAAATPTRENARAALGMRSEDLVLIYLGYIYSGKGLETLLRALKKANEGTRRVRLIAVGGVLDFACGTHKEGGSRYLSDLVGLSQALGIQDKVMWMGGFPTGSSRVSEYFCAADVCVLPFDMGAHLNNSTIAVAAAHGVPLITTAADDTEPAFKHGDNVLLCPPKRPDLLALAITALGQDPDLRRRIQHGILRMAKDWFSWDTAIDRTLAALKGSRKAAEELQPCS